MIEQIQPATPQEVYQAWKASGAKLPTKALAKLKDIIEIHEQCVDRSCLLWQNHVARIRAEVASKFPDLPAGTVEPHVTDDLASAITRKRDQASRAEAETKLAQAAPAPMAEIRNAIADALENGENSRVERGRAEHQANEQRREAEERAAWDSPEAKRQRLRAGRSDVPFRFFPMDHLAPRASAGLMQAVELLRSTPYKPAYGNPPMKYLNGLIEPILAEAIR